jgi:sulfur-oxidizing protein SoxX
MPAAAQAQALAQTPAPTQAPAPAQAPAQTLAPGPVAAAAPQVLAAYRRQGAEIPEPLAGLRGDAARGRALFMTRDGTCVLCHPAPGGDPRLTGNIGPPLDGVGSRLSAGALRLRLVEPSAFNPQTVMPSYYRVSGLTRVAPAYAGQPIYDSQTIEDMVAYLLTLRAP